MSSTFYIRRTLSSYDKTYTEAELFLASKYVVVLAEPGAGKTELMKSLARQLGATVVTANKFSHMGTVEKRTPLVIDAFDELSKIDASGIYKLLGKAEATAPTHIYLSSRSSEWDNSATSAFKEFTGCDPLVVRLCEFNENEQQEIFDHHLPGEDFASFRSEVTRFELEMLIPNPQFLKLFADAYIESGRNFTDKRSIFAQAIERLAKEANPEVSTIQPSLSISDKIKVSSDVFSKILLSGAEGVCTSEASENQMYPLLASLVGGDAVADCILATRLFKPADSEGLHRPVHKIVAEYCVADFLTTRIAEPTDPLTLSKCLPIIAPNSTVRDELRGLLGWMASLGNKSIQEAVIKLDPYAVLANGDSSQLAQTSKRLLLRQLKDEERKDPYFRRGDFWRRFSVAGFFTQDVVEEIKPLLADGNDGHLRDLLLELLAGSPAIEPLKDELRMLTLDSSESENTRLLANRCLREIEDDSYTEDLGILLTEGSTTSLQIATETIETLGPESFEQAYLAEFLRICSRLYPNKRDRYQDSTGTPYYLRKFITELDLATIEGVMDEMTEGLECVCGKNRYECDCLSGISKIVGLMLDRYFELASPPFDPHQIWQWVGKLAFRGRKSIRQSKAVDVLQKDLVLRQSILANVFGKLTDTEEIFNTRVDSFGYMGHTGLALRSDDYRFLVDLAFDTNNPKLWVSFLAGHNYYQNSDERGPNELRRHMREQALEKPLFMREWAKSNRNASRQFAQEKTSLRIRRTRSMKRHRRKQNEINASNIQYVKENRELVEAGRHWGCLQRFSRLVLETPDKIETEFGDETLVRNALRNCLGFIAPQVPSLSKLAELQCASQYLASEMILFAACLEIMRVEGNLDGVDVLLLRALRTNINMSYSAVSNEERDLLKGEVDRLIFPDNAAAENYIKQYIEPQLAQSRCEHPEVWLLNSDEVFSHLRSELPMKWLRRYKELALSPLDTLFELATQYGNRDELKGIIKERCCEFMSSWPDPTDKKEIEDERIFWLVRAWYFLSSTPDVYWNWLKADKDTVLVFYNRSSRLHGDHPHWPKLSPNKIEKILDAFIEKWPKVDLPSHWGSGSPKGENAYRFLTEVVWSLDSDDPEASIPVIDRLLSDSRFTDFHNNLKSMHTAQLRKKALRDFLPPTPKDIVSRLDHDTVVSVEGLRQLVIQELQDFQQDIDGGEYNTANRFYENGVRLDEVKSTEIVAERLNLRLQPQNITVTLEHQLKNANRCDFTATKLIGGKKRLLVTEVKGQWHKDLYTAASAQLHDRYSIHPDAEKQGIFMVIWFGADEKVANRKCHSIKNAEELKHSIEKTLPKELSGLIDVFVLDVSRPS